MLKRLVCIVVVVYGLSACSTSGPGIFGKKTPHERYADKLTDAGLRNTALGVAWFQAAERSLSQPLSVTVPYRETGYFEAESPGAVGLRFPAKKGEKLNIKVDSKSASRFLLFVDFWQSEASGSPRFIQSADTLTHSLDYEVRNDGTFLLRVQPELLNGGEYSIHISAGPSLAYPIKAPGTNHIKSFWGANRDGGARRHEGVDMFAARGTPVVAAADGFVTRVNTNNLGGKVVWMRPADGNYSLYYAHLDSQLVTDGQRVKAGDTLGLMGNTGNARTTAPHLHFGIYGNGGAVDPFPFINPVPRTAPQVDISPELLGRNFRTNRNANMLNTPQSSADNAISLPGGTIMKLHAATQGWYKVSLADGSIGYVPRSSVTPANEPLRTLTLKAEKSIVDLPDSLAATKRKIAEGKQVAVYGEYRNFYFVEAEDTKGWMSK